MKKRRIPLRKCVACGERKAKKELIRIVRTTDGQILVDPTGKINGRGAYICPDINCFDKGIKSKQLVNAFGEGVPEEVLETLRNKIGEYANGEKTL